MAGMLWWLIWFGAGLLAVLGVTPPLMFLRGRWETGRSRMLGYFRVGKLVWYYFQVFPDFKAYPNKDDAGLFSCPLHWTPGSTERHKADQTLRDAFAQHYASHFGRRWFVAPLVL